MGGRGTGPEKSHPVVWTIGLVAITGVIVWIFADQVAKGRRHARDLPRVIPAGNGPAGPDHAALLADRSPAVLERGARLYAANCLACHGPQGAPANPGSPPIRNFRSEPMRNRLGAGPFAFYQVLSEGYGSAMPAFRNLSPADRYAVTHYVRERLIREVNPVAYSESDPPEVAQRIPAKAAAAQTPVARPEVDPAAVPLPRALPALLAIQARAASASAAIVTAWLERVDPGQTAFLALARRQSGRAWRLLDALRADDRSAFTAALLADDGAGGGAVFAAWSGADLEALYLRLRAAALEGNP